MIISGFGTRTEPRIINRFRDCGTVKIGKYCSIANTVEIWNDGNHYMHWATTYPFWSRADRLGVDWFKDCFPKNEIGEPVTVDNVGQDERFSDVTIGNDVWIGDYSAIMPGVVIGDGACIGAYSVVRRDIEAYSVVRGNPAREIRKRFNVDEINMLLEMKWWDWSLHQLRLAMPLMLSPNIKGLYEFYLREIKDQKGV